jgi:hypothetical protein
MDEGNRTWRILLVAALVIGGLVALSVLFAVLGWWQLIFR